jgi:hypothetical protein
MITKDNGTVDYCSEGEYEAFVQAAIAMEADDMGDEVEHVLRTHDTSPSLLVTKVLTTHYQDFLTSQDFIKFWGNFFLLLFCLR